MNSSFDRTTPASEIRPALVRATAALLVALCSATAHAQPAAPASQGGAAPNTALINAGRSPPAYPVQYEPASPEQITEVLQRVHAYLETASPIILTDRQTNAAITDLKSLPAQVALGRGDFGIIGYEWGVTYSGMLRAAEATGDARFKDYVARRMAVIGALAVHFKAQSSAAPNPPPAEAGQGRGGRGGGFMPLRSVLTPRSLDDSGSMAAAMIRSLNAGVGDGLRPWIDNYLQFISTGQKRFADGTLARDRPLPNALWLDDLYMSVPALAEMGRLTGDRKYFDDAVKQVVQFADRMFVKERGLYMHAWIEGMEPHPAFHWGRANGWAIIAKTELLEVLPENHPGRAQVLELYRAHLRGLAAVQGINGLWHQLLERAETYEETSASAMFVYCAARGINRGWLDTLAYGPMVSAGWNAVAKQVNQQGQVEGTCVGTGMGFEPMFYAYRPVSVFAAHGYGPVLLAGSEVLTLRKGKGSEALVSDGAVQFAPSPARF